jgi:hypothetical protein
MKNVLFVLLSLGFAAMISYRPALASSTTYPITNIDKNGIVTVTDLRSKQIFRFQVTDAKLLGVLKVGQLVYPDFPNQKVSLDGKTLCCSMIIPQQLEVPLERRKLPRPVPQELPALDQKSLNPTMPPMPAPRIPGGVPQR